MTYKKITWRLQGLGIKHWTTILPPEPQPPPTHLLVKKQTCRINYFVSRTNTGHYSGLMCSLSVIPAHNELVCRLNCPNAQSHPTDLSVLISPKYTASALVRVHYLCQLFWLNRAFDLEKLILPNEVLRYHTDPADWKISFLMSVNNPVLKCVSRATHAPLWTYRAQ